MATRPARSVPRKSATELLEGLVDDSPEPATKRIRTADTPERVRVWWPPTRDKSRTGFSGAFWPAAVVAHGKSHFTVRYDNDEEERVSYEHIFPAAVPLDFGREIEDLRVGEFVEVSNGSKTDPCAWLARVLEVRPDATYLVKYPFHDAPDEVIKRALIRRARIWDGEGWKLVQLGQTWRDGEVASPKELKLLDEATYLSRYFNVPRRAAADQPAAPAAAGALANGARKGTAQRA